MSVTRSKQSLEHLLLLTLGQKQCASFAIYSLVNGQKCFRLEFMNFAIEGNVVVKMKNPTTT